MGATARARFGRDAAVAALAFAALYGLGMIAPVSALKIPAHLLVVFGPSTTNPALFGAYLVGLGVVTAAAAEAVRNGAERTGRSALRIGVAGALALVGVLSLVFTVAIAFQTSQREPVVTAGAAGLALLALAGWIGGAFGVVRRPAAE